MLKKILTGFMVLLITTGSLFANGAQETKVLDKSVDNDWTDMNWDDVLEEADGQTVNFYMWGGGSSYNDFVDNLLADEVSPYGVSINRVGVSNITEAVNTVIGEKAAGKTENGSVDIFWINGSNFMMMQQAGVTFPGWSEELPNAKYIDWDNPAIKFDMGYPVEGQESPWMTAQYSIIYDSAKYNVANLPHNYTELLAYAKSNPGTVTYPALPDFFGTRFIKAALYELTGGFEQYNKDGITKDEFEKMSAPLWDYLAEIEPYLWKNGATYPNANQQCELFNNGEVFFATTMNGMGINNDINNGKYPETAKVYCMDTAIADTNYVALTFNGGNKAGAMVVANAIINPSIQAKNIGATGGAYALDFTTLSDAQKAKFDDELSKLRVGSFVASSEKARTTAPEVSSYLNIYLEELWNEKIGIN